MILQKWLRLLGISVASTIVFITVIVVFGMISGKIDVDILGQIYRGATQKTKQMSNESSQTYSVNPSPASPSKSSPEYLLAGIDKQSNDVSSDELAPYKASLDLLEPKCLESRMALADLSTWTQDELAKKGVKANHLKIMNAVYQSVQPYTTPQKCNSSFVLISTIVNK